MATEDISEMLETFILESKFLIAEMQEILKISEKKASRAPKLEEYGLLVDRIMGGAKTLAMLSKGQNPFFDKIGDFAMVCKVVGYKASQIKNNDDLYTICVASLLDMTNILDYLLRSVEKNQEVEFKSLLSDSLNENLRILASQFNLETASAATRQAEISKPVSTQLDLEVLIKKIIS